MSEIVGLPPLSNRAFKTPASPIRKLAGFAAEAEQRGTKVYRVNIGQPDVHSPTEFFDGLKEVVAQFSHSLVPYESSQGCSELLDVWTESLNREYKIGISAKQALITMGASEALILAFMVCCDPGDEILIFDPTYANYIGFSAISGVRLVPLPCSLDKQFALPNKEEITRFISPYTRAILVCNPNNPTGSVCSDEELTLLINVCREHNLYLIADETYREFVYDQKKPRCLFELTGDDPRVIVVDSLSKRFSLCGIRVGGLFTWNDALMQAAFHIAQARLAAPTIEQIAAAHMLRVVSPNYLSDSIKEYQHRRDVAVKALSSIKGVTTHSPAGGFYLIAKIPVDNAELFATFMLKEFSDGGATTFVAPANGFYMHAEGGKDMIRIAFVLKASEMEVAIKILGKGIEVYNPKKSSCASENGAYG